MLTFLIRAEDDFSCVGGCLTLWKLVFAGLLFLEGLLFGHVVLLIKRLTPGSAFQFALHIGEALSAGVFFATGMLHVLAEAIELLAAGEDAHHDERMEDEHDDHDDGEVHQAHGAEFPWAFLILMLSFYLVFFVEQILIPKLTHHHSDDAEEEDLEFNSINEETGLLLKVEEPEVVSETDAKPPSFRSKEFFTGHTNRRSVCA